MDRFQEMQVFVRIAERRSFSKAAEDLRIPRATVTNLIKRMEKRLGARLLERTTRQVRLTHDGEAYYRRCVRLLADLEEADGAFLNTAPKGLLRVNMQGTLARVFVMPALPGFLERYPDLVLHLGDHDPSGIDMTRDNTQRLVMFADLESLDVDSDMLEVRRIALNMDQVRRYRPPPNPAKLTDSRVAGYLDRFGNESWELDALSPSVIDALIQEEIKAVVNEDEWERAIAKEAGERDALQALARSWRAP